MLREFIPVTIIFAAAFVLLFKRKLSARWKYLVLQTVTGGLLVLLLAIAWVAFSGLLEPAAGPKPVHVTLEQTRVPSLLQLMHKHPRATFYVAPAGQPQTFEVKGEVADRNTNLTVNVTAYIDTADMAAMLALTNVQVGFVHPSKARTAVSTVGYLAAYGAFIIGLVCLMVYVQSSAATGFRSRVFQKPDVRLADVAGIEEAKAEAMEVVQFLKNSKKLHALGGQLPRGILFVGSPGTGKTMLAKAIAAEANASFFNMSGSDFVELYAGVGARRVRKLFKKAMRHRPALIFIDEIDAIGGKRNDSQHEEHRQTINALLVAMDGFKDKTGIVVIGATNRVDDLDPALLRPGRFDRKVYLAKPDTSGRLAILKVHAKGKPIVAPEASLLALAISTFGMTGADLANLLNEAAITAVIRGVSEISPSELTYARDKVMYGRSRTMVENLAERRIIARHEAGHAVIHFTCKRLPPLYQVSILPRNQSLGSNMLLPNEDAHIQSKELLMEQLCMLMGGRAAESLCFDTITNGAAGDMSVARDITNAMVCEWGMGTEMYYEPKQPAAEAEINRILKEVLARAVELLKERSSGVEKIEQALLEREMLTGEEVRLLLEPQSPQNGQLPEAGSEKIALAA
jgi:cell division protease FtsH